MTTNNFFSANLLYEGVIAYHKGSLAFCIIDNTLLLAGGMGYDDEGEVLTLNDSSYVVLDNTSLLEFENHKNYYFYICQRKNVDKMENCEKEVLLEDEVVFCMSQQQQHYGLFVGEVTINYDAPNSGQLGIAENAFAPGKNKIDLRAVKRHLLLPSPVSQKQNTEMSQILFALSEALQQKSTTMGNMALHSLVNAYFQFSDALLCQTFSPYDLYLKFESHVRLFSWMDFSNYSEEIHQNVQEIEALFTAQRCVYRTDYYHLDIEDESSFFSQILRHFKCLTQSLKKDESTETRPKTVQSHIAEIAEVPLVFGNVTVIEEEVKESKSEENCTVLLNGEYKKCIQVGRGLQSGNDIILGKGDKTVSRIHLKVSPHKQGFFLEDLSSMGTYVDGERLEKSVKKFVTEKHRVVLGKKECFLDLSDFKIQALTSA